MNKFTYILLSLLFLPLGISAQEDITIVVNDESQTVTGTVITVSDTEEYIDTETHLYQVTGKNTFMLGDIVVDGIVNVTDVTTLVGMILDDVEYSKVADVDENNKVTIALVEEGVGKEVVESYEAEDITDVWIKNKNAAAVDQH